MAVAGELNSEIWGATYGTEVLDDPFSSPPFSVVDEGGRKVGSRRASRSPRRLLVVGAADGLLEMPTGLLSIEKGKVCGVAESALAGSRGSVLKVTNLVLFAPKFFIKIRLTNPELMEFPDFKSLSADVLLSSESSGKSFGAGLDYHTTIPEQPPGKSWWAQSLISRPASGDAFILGLCANYNTTESANLFLGPAELDRWYNLRLDILTHRENADLAVDQIRLDYYVNGDFKGSLFPADGPILLDSQRTGVGPHRGLAVYNEEEAYGAVAYFDNVRAVYQDRVG